MIQVDSSVWIDHWRSGDERLAQLLGQGQVWVHRFVTGERDSRYHEKTAQKPQNFPYLPTDLPDEPVLQVA